MTPDISKPQRLLLWSVELVQQSLGFSMFDFVLQCTCRYNVCQGSSPVYPGVLMSAVHQNVILKDDHVRLVQCIHFHPCGRST